MGTNSFYRNRERGITIVLFSMFLFVLCSFLAFGLELGRSYTEEHKAQIIGDAAALAGLNALVAGTTYADVVSAIVANGSRNGASSSELLQTPPRCGTWLNNAFVPQASGVCDGSSTAIEVTLRRSLPASLTSIFGQSSPLVTTRSVGYKPLYRPGNCIRPFGIEDSFFKRNAISTGSTFTVSGSQSSGNWGKIDINGNASSGTAYTEAMLSNICDDQIRAGNHVSAGTGNAQISQVFSTILSDTTIPLASQRMIFAVTTDFPNGNGCVQLLKFIRVDLLSQSGTGQNWQATLRAVDLNAEPESMTAADRDLME